MDVLIIIGGISFQNAVSIDQNVTNSLMPGLDPLDLSGWFKIAVPAGKYLIVSIISADLYTDFDAYIYDPSGTLLTAAATDSYPDACSTYAFTTGDYRIRIHPFQGSGLFTMNITISNTTGPEDGLAFGTAYSLTESAPTATGSIPVASATGYMYFRVFLRSGQYITAWLRGDSDQHDFDLYLLDNQFNQLSYSWNFEYPERIDHTATYDGYVYLLVVPCEGSGTFEIEIEFKEDTSLPSWAIVLIIILIILAIIVALILFFRMSR